jgi:hypothetical protein
VRAQRGDLGKGIINNFLLGVLSKVAFQLRWCWITKAVEVELWI